MNRAVSNLSTDRVRNDASIDLRRDVRLARPRTADQLHAYVLYMLGFTMPRVPLIAGHSAPFDYLRHAFFESEGLEGVTSPRDCIVWANRGGGKTQIAAIATLLDLLFKPGIQIRILGGSFDQSSRMYRYLKRLLESDVFSDFIAGNLTGRHVELVNGSRVEVLSQSECSVRGLRVHKLRCDEVELFDRDIWEAAQLVTRSGRCGIVHVRACIEAFSTMHKTHGLMQELVNGCRPREGGDPVSSSRPFDRLDSRLRGNDDSRRVFRWNLIDTLEHCPDWRSCDGCPLWDECQGRAKLPGTQGFFRIDDAIAQKHRVSRPTWESEMLCERPSVSDCVFAEFDPAIHVVKEDLAAGDAVSWIGGIDFGFRAPTVLLWACVDHHGVLHMVDELAAKGCLTEQFLEMASERCTSHGWPKPQWIGADPAGHQRNDQTGEGSIAAWRRAGWTIRTRGSGIEQGIEAVRRRLRRADGSVHLRIHARCTTLIESMSKYHYPPAPGSGRSGRTDSSTPVKDGPDHACDALRYMIVNLDHAPRPTVVKRYI